MGVTANASVADSNATTLAKLVESVNSLNSLLNARVDALTAEIANLKAEAVSAKIASDAALADAKTAVLAKDAEIASLKKSFNALAKKWNKKNPTAKVKYVKQ